MMKIKRISIYREFKCTGADCPVNCCRGWKVPIDEQAYQKFIQEKGLWGSILRCSIVKGKEITAFRSIFDRCVFWGPDRLCMMQKKHGTAYMPLVCIQFPRQLYNLGFFCEETLYLACPEAARLFLNYAQQDKPFDFETAEGEAGYEVNTTNDDEAFLDYLLKSRDELIQMLHNGYRFDSMAILDYGRNAQNACLANTPLPDPSGCFVHKDGNDRFAVTCDILNQLLFNGFYHTSLRTTSPLLYKLCRKYIRELGILSKKDPAAANKKLAALKSGLYQKLPDLDKVLDRYYEYFLQTDFLNVFEDYSFSKHLIYGMAKANMLWLFIALHTKNKRHVTTEELARVMAVFERRAPQMEDALVHIMPVSTASAPSQAERFI